MKIAVFSDIHANINALEAVYKDAVDQDVERSWFLGDAVGYGPDPVSAIRWLSHLVDTQEWVLGNHEAIMAGLLNNDEKEAVSPVAQEICDQNWRQIEEDADALTFCQTELTEARSKPRLLTVGDADHTLTHAGQHARHLFRYIYPWQTDIYLPLEFNWLQRQGQQRQRPQVQWFGHTHVPTLVYGYPAGEGIRLEVVSILPCERYSLKSAPLMMINPGSVGQPRDLDRRAAYAIIDLEDQELTFRRVAYDWRDVVYELEKLPLSAGTFRNLEERLRDASLGKDTPSSWRAHYERARGIGCTDAAA